MTFRRVFCAMLALAVMSTIGLGQVLPRRTYSQGSYTYDPAIVNTGPVFHSYMFPPYYSTPHYILPLPGYGVLPPHLATNPWHYYNYNMYSNAGQFNPGQRQDSFFSEARGQVSDPLDYTPRKRNALYPAVPFEKTREERLTDIRRVRFEITVPYENAVVYFDGVATKQTGLSRVFVTPPMGEDREYTATIRVEFKDASGTDRTRQKAFTFVAGETVRHTFIE